MSLDIDHGTVQHCLSMVKRVLSFADCILVTLNGNDDYDDCALIFLSGASRLQDFSHTTSPIGRQYIENGLVVFLFNEN